MIGVPLLDISRNLASLSHVHGMGLREPVLVLLGRVLEAPSLVGTPLHLYPSTARRSPTSKVLLVRSNHGALVRLVLQRRVVEGGDIHDLLASLLQQHGLL